MEPTNKEPISSFEEMEVHEKAAFDDVIRPKDCYAPDGTYWADLPVSQRVNFCMEQDRAEASKELSWLWEMFKNDPLSPISYYFKNSVLPGAGLGLEGYVLFSISNNSALFNVSYKDCWKGKTCDKNWIAAVNYMEVAGIIVGQILVGFLGDWIGRRWGLIQDAAIMFVGLLMLTAAWGLTENGWVICYAWSLFFYSIGVGGEYPMTATIGMENGYGNGKVTTSEDRLHRGRSVVGAFLMQGWGQFANQAILIILLLIFHHGTGAFPISTTATQWTYRVSFAIPAIGTAWLVYYRTYHMKAASKQLVAQKKKSAVTGYDTESLKLVFRHFTPRLIATAGGWFANDVFFYGNKLFQSKFILVISPESATNVTTGWLWNLVNITVELAGYYCAAWFVDSKLYGRKWMQIVGFMMCFILFVIPAFKFEYYQKPANIHSFQAMYFLSSFFNQFGPNCITFLVAAEVFPTPIRGTAHGISAACGKVGALIIAIVGSYTTAQQQFYIVPWFGLAGTLLTWLFLPDTTGLDLREQERRWAFIRQGREEDYHGPAIHSKHLSVWERWTGKGKQYDAELDYQMKVEEFRAEWEAAVAARGEEQDNVLDDVDESILNGTMHTYFERTSPEIRGMKKEIQEPVTLPAAASSEDQKTLNSE
ncbi:uncharacterized protein N7482_003424 [Penicillium canariense]|uniref:Major facilitator superfamily (MFS) profile domain-containing protein n=1 Tax=Penicillium canariense TaxID=189055 RepID=A0A9W9LPA5_9EURO|nr:uncharacterized protein N7482_003424 [Penicillium canariense]KAJ5167830.1 hypothetical protein N7482_003424 [Penicillium canariense]